MTDKISTLLNFDPLCEAERITGESYKDDSSTTAIGFLLMQINNAEKEEALKSINDTYWNCPINDFLDILTEEGFALILKEDINDGSGNKFRIFWNNGILVVFDSYYKDSVINGGHCYFSSEKKLYSRSVRLSGGWYGKDDYDIFHYSFDIREGFRYKLNKIKNTAPILQEWFKGERDPFIWLVHYNERGNNVDYDAIIRERYSRFPESVRNAMKLF